MGKLKSFFDFLVERGKESEVKFQAPILTRSGKAYYHDHKTGERVHVDTEFIRREQDQKRKKPKPHQEQDE